MLDQNTDRMWYVIGAVIIGAAIILIMNKTFPQLFASIGETFEGKTEDTMAMTDGILPNVPLMREHVYTKNSHYFDGFAGGPTGYEMGELSGSVLEKNIQIEPNTLYELSYEKTEASPYLVIMTMTKPVGLVAHNRIFDRVTNPDRALILTSRDGHSLKGDRITWQFTSESTGTYLAITTGNTVASDVQFAEFKLAYSNVSLHKVLRD